jgi:hypothetical protein
MSEENVEVIQKVYDAFVRDDFDAALSHCVTTCSAINRAHPRSRSGRSGESDQSDPCTASGLGFTCFPCEAKCCALDEKRPFPLFAQSGSANAIARRYRSWSQLAPGKVDM